MVLLSVDPEPEPESPPESLAAAGLGSSPHAESSSRLLAASTARAALPLVVERLLMVVSPGLGGDLADACVVGHRKPSVPEHRNPDHGDASHRPPHFPRDVGTDLA